MKTIVLAIEVLATGVMCGAAFKAAYRADPIAGLAVAAAVVAWVAHVFGRFLWRNADGPDRS